MQFTDNLTRIVGNHTLRFGVDVRKVSYSGVMFFVPSDDYGNFTFSPGLFTQLLFRRLPAGSAAAILLRRYLSPD